MNLIERFKSAAARKAQAIAAADAEIAKAAAERQAELDAYSLRARTRQQRLDAAIALLADRIEPLSLAIESLDLDYPDDVTRVVITAFRLADERCGLSGENLHWCDLSPTARTLGSIFSRNLYFLFGTHTR